MSHLGFTSNAALSWMEVEVSWGVSDILLPLKQQRPLFGDGKRENNLWSGLANTLEH